ncbi:DNA cytosine methyltransferase [Streptomyces tanashiensis]|uniref:DNA cytosine methyltransferase n=1 Tax=Streptomyces tanashiensis TaxID=67367 RepID=UPI0019AA9B9F|nr:DNA cytosine methyltransferase [Streptomyces tanashiensis]GGY51996.1 cytosine-specific methyltransferase [Streptomyces tanashiensis]
MGVGPVRRHDFTAIELCAGAGGQALGLERAGFRIAAAVDIDGDSCSTLRNNRPTWCVIQGDLNEIEPVDHDQLDTADLLSCGLPRSPYTIAGKQLAVRDKRDTLRATLDMASYVRPRVLLLESIPTFHTASKFEVEREMVRETISDLGYTSTWGVLSSTDFGVPQQRSHGFVVAMAPSDLAHFAWPSPGDVPCRSLGETLYESMASKGWPEAAVWAAHASGPAPLIMGGATGRGGADLGASRAKAIWARRHVYGGSLGDDVPGPDFRIDLSAEPKYGLVKVTVPQVALLQGFAPDWQLHGRKTSAYRQISQATPPPVAEALGERILAALAHPTGDSPQ